MFIIGNFILGIAKILEIVVNIFYILLIIRVVISWVQIDRTNQLVILLENLTDPVLDLIRRYIPGLQAQARNTGFDFTPIVAFLILYFIDIFLIDSLLRLGQQLVA
ncbi:MAG: YggT family protein [Candidatus Marinimicrobia bacterium]|nr:YggT family protein [Candidatus Neomarinimicrobiota bacterium]